MYKRDVKTFIPHKIKSSPNANFDEDFSTDKFEYDKEKMCIFAPQEKSLGIRHSINICEPKDILLNVRIVSIVLTKKNAWESRKIQE